jgi:hypothetical protein
MTPHPDGAPANTSWMFSYVDVPGVKVVDLHCGGTVRLVVQLVSTGPGSPCRPLRRPPSSRGHSESVEWLVYLPNGQMLVRRSRDGGPWHYGIEGAPPTTP